jgi:F-type H+-transporting ATPase subunit delta
VISSEVAKRYAVGLFELADEKKMLDKIASEMKAISDVCKKDRTLLDFLAAPQIRDQDKDQVLKSVFEGRVSEPMRIFLDLIVRKRRSQFLIDIADSFSDLMLENQGIIKTRVISALELSKDEVKGLQSKLEKKTGKKILMTRRVNPAIIGGVIVHLGNQVIDMSIKYQLMLLRDSLLEVKVH